MIYYKIENGKIVEALNYNDELFVPQEIKDNYLVADKEIVDTTQGLMFAEDVDQEAEERAKLEIELQNTKANKIAQLKTARDIEEQSPILYNQYYWDFDDNAIQRINGAIIALSNGGTITWTSAENEEINEVTADDLRGVISASAVRSNALHIKYRQLREQVEQATTLEEVEEIVW